MLPEGRDGRVDSKKGRGRGDDGGGEERSKEEEKEEKGGDEMSEGDLDGKRVFIQSARERRREGGEGSEEGRLFCRVLLAVVSVGSFFLFVLLFFPLPLSLPLYLSLSVSVSLCLSLAHPRSIPAWRSTSNALNQHYTVQCSAMHLHRGLTPRESGQLKASQ